MKLKLLLTCFLIFGLNAYSQKDKYGGTPVQYKKVRLTDKWQDKQERNKALSDNYNSTLKSGSSTAMEAIGETTGTLDVSLTGGATYTIPIKTPLGINGVKPDISLTYNSQSGNGIAGYGWNISGVSVITRIPSTKFHDNLIDPIDFDNSDRYSLDGQRLILKSGTYGGDGAEYQTENYSNLKISSHGSQALYGSSYYGPAYLKVQYPDGSIAHYGNSFDSRSRNDWAITYWENAQGIRVSYSYISDANNSIRVSSIKYGAKGSATPINEVKFIYKNRNRREMAFTGGTQFFNTKILDKINVLSNNVGYSNYYVNHSVNTLGYERISSIQEKNGDNTLSHSAITFNYSNTPTSIDKTGATADLSVINIEQRNAEVLTLDLEGDGTTSFIVYPKTVSQRNKYWIFGDLQTENINFASEISTSTFEEIFPVTWLTHNNKMLSGQGYTMIQKTGATQVKFKVYSKSTYGPAALQYEKTWDAPTYNSIPYCGANISNYRIPQTYLSGDFNGDGLTDIIGIGRSYSYNTCFQTLPNPGEPCGFDSPILNSVETQSDSTQTKKNTGNKAIAPIDGCCQCDYLTQNSSMVSFINLDRRLTSNYSKNSGYLYTSIKASDKLLTADVNGDGRTDLLHFTEGKVYAYTFTSTNSLSLLWQYSDSRIKMQYPPMLGDYNGDGKIDFIFPTAANSSVFAMFLSTGTTFIKYDYSNFPFQYKINEPGSTNKTYNLIATDINGDGKTDIVDYRTTTYNNSTNGIQTLTAYSNIADNGIPDFAYYYSSSKTGNLKHFPIPIFIQADKPNNNLVFGSISDKYISTFKFTKDNREEMLLKSVNNNGVTNTITYRDLDPDSNNMGFDNTPVYQSQYDQTFPNIDIGVARGFKVAVGLQRIVSGTPTLKQIISYYGAVSNTEGIGFLGFQGIAKSNWHTGYTDRIYNVSKFSSNLRGAKTLEYSQLGYFNFNSVPSDFIAKTSYTYSSSLSANKVFNILNTGSSTINNLEGTTNSQLLEYDQYINPTKITTNFNGQGSQIVEIDYYNSTGASYIIGRPTLRTETKTVGTNSFTTEEQYVYSNFLMTQKLTKGNGTPTNEEIYSYDTYGNIKTKTVTPNGSPSRVLSFKYDPSGRFIEESTDVEGLITKYNFNQSSGVLNYETNPYNQTTNFDYDGWNRLISATDYLGNSTNTLFSENSSNEYTVTVSSDEGTSEIKIYDKLKRLKLSKYKNVLGQWVSKSYTYDKFDRLIQESEPYLGSSPSQWNTTTYDVYGRVMEITAYTGKTTTLTYSGLSTTVDDGTKTVTTTKDALGNILSVQDPGGTVTYKYFGNGQMKEANYDGNVVTISQNGWGRKTQLIDPSAGTYSYTYNGFGEMLTETTPNGTTSYTYDSKGKLTQKRILGTNTDMTINHSYNSSTKLISGTSLTSSDGNNSTYSYSYDGNKRLINTIETTPFASFAKSITYDSFGRVATEENTATYLANNKSSTKKIRNGYQNGGLITMHDAISNNLLWTLNTINARGQITKTTVGNSIEKTNTYDSFGFITNIKSEKTAGSTPVTIMNLGYSFNNQTGNLNSRTNSMFGWSESFGYDSLDRLTTINSTGGNSTQNYDAKGRITSNSSIGSYSYSGNSYQHQELDLNTAGESYYNALQKQLISYNTFKAPVAIEEEGKDKVSFLYNAQLQRSAMYYGGTQTNKNDRRYHKFYAANGSMEIKYDKNLNKTTFVTYIGGDAYNAPIIWHSETNGGGYNNNYYYLHRDYQSSVLAITAWDGLMIEKRHFDAWGNIVKLQGGAGNNLTSFKVLDRGYTGHEHLIGVGLVHMNARLYDPILHRFLAPDNFVQDPFNTQNFNRYGYVYNNPLKYIDPNGEFIVTAIIIGAALATAYMGGVAANGGNYNPTEWDWKSGDTWVGVVGGGILGAASAGAGLAVTSSLTAAGSTASIWALGAGSATGGIIQGGGLELLPGGGGNVLQGAAIGGLSGFVGGVAGGFAAKHISTIAINGFTINGPLVKGAVGGAFGGFVGGYTGGFTSGYLSTGDFGSAHQSGLQSGVSGTVTGTIFGTLGGYQYAKQNDLNPWSGIKNGPKIILGRGMNDRINPAALDMGAETISKDWHNKFGSLNILDEHGLDFNSNWLNSKMNQNYNIYDFGRGSFFNNNGLYYGLELQMISNYSNLSSGRFLYNNYGIRIINYGN